MEFSRDLRDGVAKGRITVSIRLWKKPRVKVGNRYSVGQAVIEVDEIELLPFSGISAADVRASGERDPRIPSPPSCPRRTDRRRHSRLSGRVPFSELIEQESGGFAPNARR